MLPIELLYRLTHRDAAMPLWGFISNTIIRQATGTDFSTLATDFRATIPAGHILNVTHVGVSAIPALGNSVVRVLALVIDNPGPSQTNIILEDPVPYLTAAPGANDQIAVARAVDLVMTPDEGGLVATGTFNAIGGTQHALRLFYSGYILPRGNIARF